MESIKNSIMPSQKTATEEIKGTFAKTKSRERSESARADAAEDMRRRHGEAERVARLTSGPEPQLGKDIDPDGALDESAWHLGLEWRKRSGTWAAKHPIIV